MGTKWNDLPEEIREEYIERIQAQDFHPCDRRDEFKVYELAQELYEEETGN